MKYICKKFLELRAIDLKTLLNTFLATFLNVVFRNEKHLISRLHYIVKTKKVTIKNNSEVASGALKNISLGI